MTEWYRRKTWSLNDEQEFFKKLNRARKYNRAQYLKVQAIELIETKSDVQLEAAEMLLKKVLIEYPKEITQKSQAYNSLGDIYKLREDYETALEYYQKSLDFEEEFPNVITTSYLEFAQIVVRTGKTELYDQTYRLLTKKMNEPGLIFPIENYIVYSVLSVISAHNEEFEQSKKFGELAEQNATAENNTLWNPRKKNYGLVKKRIKWLDNLVRKK